MEVAAAILAVFAFLFALAGNFLFLAIEIEAKRVGFSTKLFKSLPYALELLRFYKQAASVNKWPTWWITAHWICVVGMFVTAILAFVLFEYSQTTGN